MVIRDENPSMESILVVDIAFELHFELSPSPIQFFKRLTPNLLSHGV